MSNKHFNKLVKMYENAPINKIFNPNIKISLGKSEISILAKSDFFHSANSLHGSIFFKMLDDAAYFAALDTLLRSQRLAYRWNSRPSHIISVDKELY